MNDIENEIEKQQFIRSLEYVMDLYVLIVQEACYNALPWYKKLWWQPSRPRHL